MIWNQTLWLDQSLLLEFPDEAAVGIVFKIKQGLGQFGGFPGTITATVIKIKPPPLLQGQEGGIAAFAVKLSDDVAVGGDLGIHLQQSPQAVVSIHHPEPSESVAHHGNRLAAQILETLPSAFIAEVPLTAPDFSEPNAHLRGLEITNPDFDQTPVIVMIWNPVIARQMHTRLQVSTDSTLCGSRCVFGSPIVWFADMDRPS
ncbi:MAG: Uncharacterised protein [Cyanobium sp. ARS6]|nr:MAG: Uncharacterised protein [Cyanobium sp. ARS6]